MSRVHWTLSMVERDENGVLLVGLVLTIIDIKYKMYMQ